MMIFSIMIIKKFLKNYQNIMQAFTYRPEVNSTVQNVVNRSDTTFSFPEYITDASQVGVVTSALVCRATQAIASHVRVNHLQGAAQGADVLVGGSEENRGMREKDKNILYLI